MTSENDVEISWPDSGNPANTYTLGEVDTSTYSCEGLSWVSDDSGWVKDASSGSGAGRTVAFFIDGQQVPQPVAVARISEVSRVDQNTVEINYTVKDSHADPGEKNIVEFSVDDGELSVGDTGDMEKAVLWNTDIAYNEGDGSTSTQASSSAEIDPMREVEPSGEVELSDMISMETSNGDEIRCTLKSIAECSRSGRQGLWNVDGKDVNYVDMKTGEGNMSDLGQGWQRSAVRLEKGERLEVKWSGGGTFIAWDGENVIRDAIAPYGDAIILTPDGLVTVPQ